MSKSIRTLNFGYGKIRPKLLSYIVDKYGGYRKFKKLSKETRYMLIGDALKCFKEEIIRKYGSASNYNRIWLKRQGLRKIDYLQQNAKINGFEDYKGYLDYRYQLKGFKDRTDFYRFRRLRKKYHRSISDFEVRERQLTKEFMAEQIKDKNGINRTYKLGREKLTRITKGIIPTEIKLEVQKELQKFILHRRNMRKNSGESQKMKTKTEEISIHPTIDVCGKKNREAFDSFRDQSHGIGMIASHSLGENKK